MAMSDVEEDMNPVLADTPAGSPEERPLRECPGMALHNERGKTNSEKNARAWIETAPSPPIEVTWDIPRDERRLGPAIDLMYAEVAARRRSQWADLKGKKRMAEGPQRTRAVAEEPGRGEMPTWAPRPPAHEDWTRTEGGQGWRGVHADGDRDESQPHVDQWPRGAGPREATSGEQIIFEGRRGMGMPWMDCETHEETIQNEVKRLWDGLQYLANTVADLREENVRKTTMEDGRDQRQEKRELREATGVTEDSLMGRMARLEWMMERVMHTCSAIGEKIGQGPC